MPDFVPLVPKMLLGIAADHGGYELKAYLAGKMREASHEAEGTRETSGSGPAPDGTANWRA